jgi:hypothetical protein
MHVAMLSGTEPAGSGPSGWETQMDNLPVPTAAKLSSMLHMRLSVKPGRLRWNWDVAE